GRRGRRDALEVLGTATAGRGARDRRLEYGERLPHIAHRHIVQQQRIADAGGDRFVMWATYPHELRARTALHQAAALELAQRLAQRRAVDAELPRQLGLGRQPLALAQAAAEDACADRRGHLAIGGLDDERGELDAHAAASNSSRPISMRRISWVPA